MTEEPSNKYLLNTKQPGEALELLNSLEDNSANLVFLDPQYEPVRQVLHTNYPLSSQSDYQVLKILEQIERVLKPSSFCLLWVNKTLLGNDRVPLWLLKTPNLKIVDLLVWDKDKGHGLGVGSYFRSNAEFAFLLQKHPKNSKYFKNRSLRNVWREKVLPPCQRSHPHQKPYLLSKTLIEATTQAGDLIVDPCAGSFQLLDICQELNRNYLGVDLTYNQMTEFREKRSKESKISNKAYEKEQ